MLYGYIKRFTAGAVFGLYMAYLLYFLNPQLDSNVPTIALAAATYAVIGGFVFGTALWGMRWLRVRLVGRGDTTSRHGFGNVAAMTAIAAGVYWLHLVLFRIYLPRGAVRVLSKSTILIAAAAFLLFLIWLVERNASRATSRVLFAAGVSIILISAALLYQRRDGYKESERGVVYAEVAGIGAQRRPIIWIAARGVSYDSVLVAIGEGLMPNTEELRDHGFATRVEPFRTSSPKAIWASLATGQLPLRHGVTGRFSYRTALSRGDETFRLLPTGVGFTAWGLIPPLERRSAPIPAGDSLALWQMFDRLGLRTAVINWPGAERATGHGLVIGESRIRVTNANRRETIETGAAQRLSSPIRAQLDRLAPRERASAAARFVDDRRAVDAASVVARNGDGVTIVALNGHEALAMLVGSASNTLPPRGSRAGDVLRAHLAFLDELLGELRRVRPDALVVFTSPSAAIPPPLPLSLLSLRQTIRGLVDPGQDDGFLLLGGSGVATRPNPASAAVVDVVPTILFAAGVPNARDLDGEIITDAFDDEFLRSHPTTFIPSYQAERFIVRH